MRKPYLPVTSPRKHSLAVRVFYGDTDQMGVVYYANYLRWFEMGRNEYLRAAGLPYSQLESAGFVLPVIEAHCKYIQPARYDDVVEIDAWVAKLGRVRVQFHYEIHGPGRLQLLATGHTVHACVTPEGRPQRLPASLQEILN